MEVFSPRALVTVKGVWRGKGFVYFPKESVPRRLFSYCSFPTFLRFEVVADVAGVSQVWREQTFVSVWGHWGQVCSLAHKQLIILCSLSLCPSLFLSCAVQWHKCSACQLDIEYIVSGEFRSHSDHGDCLHVGSVYIARCNIALVADSALNINPPSLPPSFFISLSPSVCMSLLFLSPTPTPFLREVSGAFNGNLLSYHQGT